MTIEIQGQVHPKFEAVRDAFAKEFADGNELGASLCLTLVSPAPLLSPPW